MKTTGELHVTALPPMVRARGKSTVSRSKSASRFTHPLFFPLYVIYACLHRGLPNK